MFPAGLTPLIALLLAAPAETPPSPAVNTTIARADELWSRRAEGRRGARAEPQPIGRAIELYEEALATDPADLEARWKLMRALYFLGDYVETDEAKRLAVFERGKTLAEEGLDRLAAAFGGREQLDRAAPEEIAARLEDEPNAAPLYVWSAIHWGLWGRTRGKIASARQGVGNKIRDYAEVAIALDEAFDDAAGRRILGRLHTEAPKIPFVTGWVDRERSISELDRSVELAPDNPVNELYFAEALIEFDRDRRDEGLERLRELVSWEPRPELATEDAKALDDARRLLERVDGGG